MGNTVNNQKLYFSQHRHNFPSMITVTVFQISVFLDCLISAWWLRKKYQQSVMKDEWSPVMTVQNVKAMVLF